MTTLRELFQDHYWDTFEADKEIIMKHIDAVLKMKCRETTCYLDRSSVRILVMHNAATQAILPEVDALPIFVVEDFLGAPPVPNGEQA